MANYASLKAAIQQVVKQNGNNEITGALLQQSLLSMINSLGVGYQFMGVATPGTNPGTPDQNVFYIASESGIYSNFGGLAVSDGEVAIFKYNGTWTKEVTGAATAAKVTQLDRQINGAEINYIYGSTLAELTHIYQGYQLKVPAAGTALANVTRAPGTNFRNARVPVSGAAKVIYYSYTSTSGYGSMFVDANDNVISGYAKTSAVSNPITLDVPENAVYFIYSYTTANGANNFCRVIIDAEKIPTEKIADGAVTTPKIADESVTVDKFAPGAIADGLVDSTKINMSFNLIDFANLVGGTYIDANGNVATTTTTTYRATNFIPLFGKKVFYGLGMGSYGSATNGAAVYDENKNFIRAFRPGASGSYDPVSAAENAAYIRLTLVGSYLRYYVVYADANGNDPIVSAGSQSIVTANINYYREQLLKYSNPGILFDKTALPELLPAYSIVGQDGFREQFDSVAAGGYVNLDATKYPSYLKTVHTISFKAETMGTLGENDGIRVGVYRNNTTGKAARITATDIRIQRYDAQSGYVNNIVFEHGLTITEFVILELNFNWYGGSLRLVSRDGAFYQEWQYSQYSYTGNAKETSGVAFVESTIALTGVKLGQNSKCFRKPIWFIGDSYTTMSLSRWTEQLVENMKIDNQLIAGYAGAGSDAMEPQLELMLQYGTPKYLVWCLGMNDYFAVWMNYAKKIEMICQEKGITLVYQTIPKSNSEKDEINLYIRNSGYRYIDFVSAVMRNGQWFPDMDDDGTHPTVLGAKVLAGQILIDLPEICDK